MGISKPKSDRRLLGTWKSDRALTLRWWKTRPGLSMARKREFLSLFGKLRHRFTRDRLYWDLQGSKGVDRYKILATDNESLAIALSPLTRDGKRLSGAEAESKILYLQFYGDKHYSLMAPHNVEFFKRVMP